MKARLVISSSEATAFHARETQLALARSATESLSRMRRRVSRQERAEKLEFIGEIVEQLAPVPAEVVSAAEEELRCWVRVGSGSSSSPPQQPIDFVFLSSELKMEEVESGSPHFIIWQLC
ncbi:unnamed protein product, partial [Linum tenue]